MTILGDYINDVTALVNKHSPQIMCGAAEADALVANMFNENTTALLLAATIPLAVRNNPRVTITGDRLVFDMANTRLVLQMDELSWHVTGKGVAFNEDKANDDIAADPTFSRIVASFAATDGDIDIVDFIQLKSDFISTLIEVSAGVMETIEANMAEAT